MSHPESIEPAFRDPNPTGSPRVVLIHGLGSDGTSWVLQEQALIHAGLRPLAVDVPGFGRSPAPQGRWSIRKAAGVLLDWLDGFGEEKVHLIGLSMGGVIALEMALTRPDRINRLILASTFARLRPRSMKEAAYLLRRAGKALVFGAQSQAADVAYHLFPGDDQVFLREMLVQQIQSVDAGIYRAAMQSLALHNAVRRLKNVLCPVLVIGGREDGTVSIDTQMELARGIPGARCAIIERAGHAVIIDQPEAFNREMIDFLRGA